MAPLRRVSGHRRRQPRQTPPPSAAAIPTFIITSSSSPPSLSSSPCHHRTIHTTPSTPPSPPPPPAATHKFCQSFYNINGTPARGTYSLLPGVLGGDTYEGYIFISAWVFLEGTPVMGNRWVLVLGFRNLRPSNARAIAFLGPRHAFLHSWFVKRLDEIFVPTPGHALPETKDKQSECLTRSSTKDLLTPFKEPERVFHSIRKLFKTTSLDYSSLPEFNLFSDPNNQSEEEDGELKDEALMKKAEFEESRDPCSFDVEWEDFEHANHIGTNANYNPYLDISRIFNSRAEKSHEEAIKDKREPMDDYGISDSDDHLVSNNAPDYVNEEEEQYKERRWELLGNPNQELPTCKIKRIVAIKECGYNDWIRTKKDVCYACRDIFTKMDEGWFMTRAE
ncbi:hypothetical protein Tco_0715067 [Tanacetum coccineum]